jgi:hypothetical protein
MSLRGEEARCAAGRTAPRVSLDDIEAAIAARYDVTGNTVIEHCAPARPELDTLSICLLVLRNGWTVIGKSAPVSLENFDAELGRDLAYQDAVRQIWPLMGFALKERLAAGGR